MQEKYICMWIDSQQHNMQELKQMKLGFGALYAILPGTGRTYSVAPKACTGWGSKWVFSMV